MVKVRGQITIIGMIAVVIIAVTVVVLYGGDRVGLAGKQPSDSSLCDTGVSGSNPWVGEFACHPITGCAQVIVPGTGGMSQTDLCNQFSDPYSGTGGRDKCNAQAGCTWGANHLISGCYEYNQEINNVPNWCAGYTCHPINACAAKPKANDPQYYENLCSGKKQSSPLSDANMMKVCTGACHYAKPGEGDAKTPRTCPAVTPCTFSGKASNIDGHLMYFCPTEYKADFGADRDAAAWKRYCESPWCRNEDGTCKTASNECCLACTGGS